MPWSSARPPSIPPFTKGGSAERGGISTSWQRRSSFFVPLPRGEREPVKPSGEHLLCDVAHQGLVMVWNERPGLEVSLHFQALGSIPHQGLVVVRFEHPGIVVGLHLPAVGGVR